MTNQAALIIIFGMVLLVILRESYCATMTPLCHPGIIDDMPLHIKKVCLALENSDQLNTALKSYINKEASALITKSQDLLENYGKRTDVDHVFLRFGKKR